MPSFCILIPRTECLRLYREFITQRRVLDLDPVNCSYSKYRKLSSQNLASVSVGHRISENSDRILVMTYSNEGLNITRAVFRDHPEVWFWQPYNLQLVSKQIASLDLVLQQVNILVW